MTDKEKLKEILKWCKINAKRWDPDQHDGPAEFKAICDLIEEKGYYKKDEQAPGLPETKNFSLPLALARGQRLQATSGKLQASSRKLDKTKLQCYYIL